MKVAPVAAALAFAGPALAQSSVGIYGIVDVAGQYLSGHSRDVRIISGGLAGSRLGFRGQEDLGTGLRADFVLEGGLNVDEGSSTQGGALFGRQAFLALRMPAGIIGLGRQYSGVFYATTEFSTFSNTGAGPTTAVIGGFAGGYEPVRGSSPTGVPPAAGASTNGGPTRVNNSIRYATPTWNGFTADALYGAGELPGQTRQGRLLDVDLRYTVTGFDAILSYIEDKAVGADGPGTTNVATTTGAVSYSFDSLRIVGGYLEVDDKRAAEADGHGFWLGCDYRSGPQVFKFQFVQNSPVHVAKGRTNAYGLGWSYDFSKRTALYFSLTRFQSEAEAGVGGLGRLNAPVPVGLTTPGDNSVTEAVLGLRHSF